MLGITQYQIWIQVPMLSPAAEAEQFRSDPEETNDNYGGSTWEW